MKKLSGVMLSLCCVFLLTACGAGEKEKLAAEEKAAKEKMLSGALGGGCTKTRTLEEIKRNAPCN